MKPTIGFIGTGVMGASMASHLLKANYPLMVFNRTISKANALVEQGAQFQEPSFIAQNCNIVITMLGYPSDLEDLLFSQNIIKQMKPNSILIDHTTSSPSLAKKIYSYGQDCQVQCLDIPVTGGDIGAKNGTLLSLAGGDKQTLQNVELILKCYSQKVVWFGDAGSGQQAKCCNQIMVATNLIGVCEMLIYAGKSGLDQNQIVELLKVGSAGASFQLERLAPRILAKDFEPGFYVEHFVKDLGIVLEECEKMQIKLPGTQLAKTFFQQYQEMGGGRNGTQGVINVIQKMNGIQN